MIDDYGIFGGMRTGEITKKTEKTCPNDTLTAIIPT
jgi:hypothetical protein